MALRHVPARTCAGCRQIRPKREMVRIVRTPAGPIEVDETGKRSGRGTYLCRDRACWSTALRRGALSTVLKAELSPNDRQGLEQFAATMPERSPAGAGGGDRP